MNILKRKHSNTYLSYNISLPLAELKSNKRSDSSRDGIPSKQRKNFKFNFENMPLVFVAEVHSVIMDFVAKLVTFAEEDFANLWHFRRKEQNL